MNRKEVRELILRAGGSEKRVEATKALAHKLGVDRMTPFRWWVSGRIPKWWIEKVRELGAKLPDSNTATTVQSKTYETASSPDDTQ